ncbi:MAG: hypothetical protein HDS66_00725 [Bacteroidales bacterium]|nr:hypothetical protein [Bacteroidales bacterium]
MNNKSYLYSYLLTLIGGVLLVVMQGRENLFQAIAIIVGLLFLIPGIATLFRVFFPSKVAKMAGERPGAGLVVVAAASTIFGIILVVAPHLFVNFMVYAFGTLLIICGLVQLFNFLPGLSNLGLPKWYLATPILSVLIGILIMVIGADKILNILALITGIVLIVYSVNGLIGFTDRSKRVKHGGVTGRVVNIE